MKVDIDDDHDHDLKEITTTSPSCMHENIIRMFQQSEDNGVDARILFKQILTTTNIQGFIQPKPKE